MTVKNYAVHSYAEEQHGDKAAALLRKVVTGPYVQKKVRLAVENTILTNDAHALNRWLDEPGALRKKSV